MATKIRLTLDLSERMNATLEELARDSGSPKSEVLRDAIRLAEAANRARRNGWRVGATAVGEDRLEQEFIL